MNASGPISLALAALIASSSAHATVYEITDPGSTVFGTPQTITAVYEDTLLDIARRYSIGYEEITRANPGVDLWLPGAGKTVVIPRQRILPPGPREGIVVNLPEHRLYYYPKPAPGEPARVITFPVSVGKMDWRTPIGRTVITAKQAFPSWHPPESVRKEHAARGEPLPAVVPPGPDNPLGEYAMRLGIQSGSYLIHGTNNPMAVGMAVTHGCIRMYPEDIKALFPLVPVGTPVWLINEPVKLAYANGELLLEVHPQIDAQGQAMEPDLTILSARLDAVLGANTTAIHWDLAREVLKAANGMPAIVGLEAQLDPSVATPVASHTELPPAPAPALHPPGSRTPQPGSAQH